MRVTGIGRAHNPLMGFLLNPGLLLVLAEGEGQDEGGHKQQQERQGGHAGDGGAYAVAVREEGHHDLVGAGREKGGAKGPVGPDKFQGLTVHGGVPAIG